MPVSPLVQKITAKECALALCVISLATISGAWVFEYFGYLPCELCLKQRWAYYLGVPLAGLLYASLRFEIAHLPRITFALLSVLWLASCGFGIYHSGVEWQFWPGPTDCTGSLTKAPSITDFLQQLESVKVVRCDAVAIRILGLSLAGWNAVISLSMALIATLGVIKTKAQN
ncbi:MAG: disulfide bond formation protein B [Alphaproteobacteria bacterium]|nr:disulfide bond formation protein B [Alphaproteobacteria bacterium]